LKRVAPGEQYVVPQWQKSKGYLILTAALELSANQLTHFYSRKKNTGEMVKLADALRLKYRGYRTLYLSWDAASWHVSKELADHLDKVNSMAETEGVPVIETMPLPAGAQFLNVIESVFSGMARAIIHNSDYSSPVAATEAIDRYIEERNAHFRLHPQRAGKKIWGQERVPSFFAEEHNCKDPMYMFPQ
jgi:predicted nuclease with RNAse H fold